MTAQIIDLRTWRIEHSEHLRAPAGLYSELLRASLWPLRVWLACWGVG